MKFLPVVCLLTAALALTGCTMMTNAAREMMGMPPLSDPSIALKPPSNGRAPATAKQGLVLYVDTTRVAVDLTAGDGVRPGTLLSLRRDRVPIVHPVTGEVLGDLDEEVATARVTEVRDKFSVAELQSVSAGAAVQIKDRVVAK